MKFRNLFAVAGAFALSSPGWSQTVTVSYLSNTFNLAKNIITSGTQLSPITYGQNFSPISPSGTTYGGFDCGYAIGTGAFQGSSGASISGLLQGGGFAYFEVTYVGPPPPSYTPVDGDIAYMTFDQAALTETSRVLITAPTGDRSTVITDKQPVSVFNHYGVVTSTPTAGNPPLQQSTGSTNWASWAKVSLQYSATTLK